MIISVFYKAIKRLINVIDSIYSNLFVFIALKGNNVQYSSGLVSNGRPVIDVWKGGLMKIGQNFRMNNGSRYNRIGRQQPCMFVVSSGAKLSIGNNTGISGTAIICYCNIDIGSNVKIGGNTVIYDTDFHSLQPLLRANNELDRLNVKKAPVIILDDVFIGAHSTILKGVSIGENSIIGAGSVVTKNIPPNEIWAGNPAKFIRKISNN